MTEPAENKQPSFAIRTNFAQRHDGSAKLAGIETGFLIWSEDRTATGVDDQGGTVAYSVVPARRVWVQAFESFPLRFLVREMHGPLDLRLGRGDFLHGLSVLVIAEQTKPSRLALDSPLRISIAAPGTRMRSRFLRTDKESVQAITYTRDTDRRMNLDRFDSFHDAAFTIEI